MLRRHSRIRPQPRRCAIDALEPRLALDFAGSALAAAPYLTLSFAPDGTDVGGTLSSLFAKFDALAPRAEWQTAILRAFQSWVVHANGDVGVVPDQGLPLGSPGSSQRDARFGDVRVVAVPMSADVLAVSVPASTLVAGTWSGDLVFNADGQFNSLSDLESVALHEAGHVFGLEHSPDPLSPMHVHGPSAATTFTAGDLVNLTALHGLRSPDLNELEGDNDRPSRATRIRLVAADGSFHGQSALVAHGDITTTADIDYFYLPRRSGYAGPVTFTLRTDGVSLLAPRLTVFDSDDVVLGTQAAAGHQGGRVSVTIDYDDREEYIVEVRGNVDDVFGVGGYALITTFDAALQTPPQLIEAATSGAYRFVSQADIQQLYVAGPAALFNDDLHSDDLPADALALKTTPGFAPSARYEHIGSLADPSDADLYEVKSPNSTAGQPLVMTVLVHSFAAGGLIPRLSIFDRNGNQLATKVLANGEGDLVVQLVGAEPDANHLVRVVAQDAASPFGIGSYRITIMFGNRVVEQHTFGAGSLDADTLQQNHSLYVGQTQLFSLLLESTPINDTIPTVLIATLRDSQHQVRWRVAAAPGNNRSAESVLLEPGHYSLQVAGLRLSDSPLPNLTYRVRGAAVSQPVGPAVEDPTGNPIFECPDNPDAFCYPDGTSTTDPFLWSQFLDALPELPTIDPAQLVSALVGGWWSWLWTVRQAVNVAPQTAVDAYGAVAGQPRSVGSAIGVLANDTDPDSSLYGAVVTRPAQHGALVVDWNGAFTYTPNPGFVGVDTFSYQVSDNMTSSNPATVVIYVAPTSPTIPGDFNHDGVVGLVDLVPLRDAMNTADPVLRGWTDLDGNLRTDRGDLAVFASLLGSSSSGSTVVAATSPAALVATSGPRMGATRQPSVRLSVGTANPRSPKYSDLDARRLPTRRSHSVRSPSQQYAAAVDLVVSMK